MKKDFTRRDFLKLAGLLPLSVATPHLIKKETGAELMNELKAKLAEADAPYV